MIKGIMSESLHIKGIMSKEFSAIRCLDFNGSTDYVQIPDDVSLQIGTHNFTWEGWIKTNMANGTVGFWSCYKDTNNRYYFSVDPEYRGGKAYVYLKVNGNPRISLISNNAVNDSVPHHLVLSVDRNDKVKMYVDKILQTSQPDISAYSAENWTIDADKYIGRRVTDYFKDLICGVRIYNNKTLNLTEIISNFNGKITQDGLVAEWLMREQQGNIIHDTSINSNHGTIYGADWYEEKFNTPLKGIMSNSSEIKGIMTAEYT